MSNCGPRAGRKTFDPGMKKDSAIGGPRVIILKQGTTKGFDAQLKRQMAQNPLVNIPKAFEVDYSRW